MRDLETFLAPVDGSDPSGAELRNDPRFHAIERLLEPASRENRLSDLNAGGTGAVALDWGALLEDASALAGEGRDLRLLVIVARAVANEAGFAGLGAGLTLLAETVERNWDELHPALRDSSSAREAAVRRINALYQIENDDNGILGDLQFNTVLEPRGVGAVSGADLAAGTLKRTTILSEAPSGLGEAEKAALMAAHETRVQRVTTACRATAAEQPELLQALVNDVAAAEEALGKLEQTLDARIAENGSSIRFKALGTFLERVAATLAIVEKEEAATTGAPAPKEIEMASTPKKPNGADPALPERKEPASPAASSVPGQINSRRDVERCLDMIIDFYERTEPSSPIPHLARRVRKMVPMNFIELMEEIAPSGMKEFRNVAGAPDEKSK
ncbi:hypothetical protein DEA8626_02244 [Defluviimonas aquaemixtae]|uniref:ImpA N-terminal domain-containing protein n=1 Tax=Albidovulum aquaemixtae TaxID=1542388 RepID=A0A2R8B825_9RHOB|nr:type VI secretion system ImpA family N-terminal domain-containing protein [Defluviimonas aquaemixtae]SPH18702.1 hypothetical protein DEA8626_02244 [Defluviimonas aquaemixtae]